MKRRIAFIGAFFSFISVSVLSAGSIDDPMHFERILPCGGSSCANYILAIGEIKQNSAKLLRDFLQDNRASYVYFHSDGGSLVGAIKLGRLIREMGLRTHVGGPYEELVPTKEWRKKIVRVKNARCNSACVLESV